MPPKPSLRPGNEHPPHEVFPLPYGFQARRGGIPYRPHDRPVQEDWESVAKKFGVGVKELIYYNFMTADPKEVNWYLHHYVGCVKVSPSGNNWMFSNGANPGIIFIPPPDDETIDVAPEEICLWVPTNVQKFLMRLFAISQGMVGAGGKRIRKSVQVMLKAGYPACLDLWYYNDLVIKVYVDLNTKNQRRHEMTKATRETLPFDGDSGVYSQQGSEERNRGNWRIHPVKLLFDEFGCGSWDSETMAERLEEIDDEMWKGWHELELVVNVKTGQGGASAFGPLVSEFIEHVGSLAQDETHLYSVFE